MSSISFLFNNVLHPEFYFNTERNPVAARIERIVYKCALTVFAGIGVFLLGEGIVRVPCIFHSPKYLPIHGIFIQIADRFRELQNGIESVFHVLLKSKYTEKFDFCISGPIIEELAHRLIFQEFIMKKGVHFFLTRLEIPLDSNSIYAKIMRVGFSALVFAAQHRWAFSTSLILNPYGAASLVYLVSFGIILGAVQETTGNILYSTSIHIINNTLTYYLT